MDINRRTFLTSALGAAGAVALGACSGQQQPGPGATGSPATTGTAAAQRATLRLPGGDFGLPSPFTYSRGPGLIQTSYIYDTLLWKDSTGNLLPWLATSYERSDDGRTYTFQLREGVSWHDGEQLTAEDVAFTFNYYAQHSDQISPQVIAPPVPEVTEVTATDTHTVRFRLSAPAWTFDQFGGAGAVPIAPQHIWSEIDNPAQASDPELLVGSGPYQLESYTPGEGAYLYTAYDDYFQGRPVVERIESTPVEDELQALQTGDLDQAGASGVRDDVLAPFRNNADFSVLTAPPGSSTLSLYWNLAQGGALADPQFRHACARAIDQQDMIERLFGGNGTPGNPGWIPPENPFHAEVDQYPFDRQAANRMLDEAGYTRPDGQSVRQTPDGQPLRFSLLVESPATPPVELVVQYLEAVGVGLEVQAVDRPTFNERVIAGETEMSLIGSGGMNSALAPDYLRLVYSAETELTQHAQGYDNSEVTRLCEQQLRTLDRQERMQIVSRIQELVAQDLPLLPLFYPDSFSVVNQTVFDDWYYTPGGVAGVVPTINNKQLFITGQPTGLGPEIEAQAPTVSPS